jgi:hypothetical protein
MAILASIVARVGGNKNAKPEQFMPTFDGPSKKNTTDEMYRMFKRFAKKHNEMNAERRRRQGKT